MGLSEYGQDDDGDDAYVPEGVLEGIEDVLEGRTVSDGELDDAIKF